MNHEVEKLLDLGLEFHPFACHVHLEIDCFFPTKIRHGWKGVKRTEEERRGRTPRPLLF
jgi:hypothetical protein